MDSATTPYFSIRRSSVLSPSSPTRKNSLSARAGRRCARCFAKIRVMHRYLLHNDDIRETAQPLLSPGQVGFLNGWGVFSTLRIAGGVLFAFERHYARMRYDAVRLRVPFEISPGALEKSLLALVDANGALDATLRVAIIRNKGGFFESPGLARDCD